MCVFAASSIIHEARTLSCTVIFPRTSGIWDKLGLSKGGELEGGHWAWDCVLKALGYAASVEQSGHHPNSDWGGALASCASQLVVLSSPPPHFPLLTRMSGPFPSSLVRAGYSLSSRVGDPCQQQSRHCPVEGLLQHRPPCLSHTSCMWLQPVWTQM